MNFINKLKKAIILVFIMILAISLIFVRKDLAFGAGSIGMQSDGYNLIGSTTTIRDGSYRNLSSLFVLGDIGNCYGVYCLEETRNLGRPRTYTVQKFVRIRGKHATVYTGADGTVSYDDDSADNAKLAYLLVGGNNPINYGHPRIANGQVVHGYRDSLSNNPRQRAIWYYA